MREAIQRSITTSRRAVIAFVDIGLLRDVNDAFGADAGDDLLRAVGARLSTIDLPGTRVSRYEGAEFVLVFSGIDSVEHGRDGRPVPGRPAHPRLPAG